MGALHLSGWNAGLRQYHWLLCPQGTSRAPEPWGEARAGPGLSPFAFSRSGDVVEYLPKSQWFVRCREMAARAAQVRKDPGQRQNQDAVGREATWPRGLARVLTQAQNLLRRFGRSF